MTTEKLDLTGQRFGRLTVLYECDEDERRHYARPRVMWVCQCDCGEEAIATTSNLRQGATRSCGCLRRETSAINGHRRLGMKKRTHMGGMGQ